MDGIVSVLAHQITGSVTDLDGFGFYDSVTHGDNADGCEGYYLDVPTDSQPYYNTYGSNGMKFLIQANMDPINSTCVHGLEIPVPPPPPPPVLKQCKARGSNGRACKCARGQGTKDGCVCSSGKCVSFCAANNGRRCKACGSVSCKCKRGACKALSPR